MRDREDIISDCKKFWTYAMKNIPEIQTQFKDLKTTETSIVISKPDVEFSQAP